MAAHFYPDAWHQPFRPRITRLLPLWHSRPVCPVERQTVSTSKAEYIQLKHDAHYWRAQFSKLSAHSRRDLQPSKRQRHAALQDALTQAQAQVRELQHCLLGHKSERSNGLRATLQPQPAGPRRPRGQERGKPGHGRTRAKTLPGIVEAVVLPAVDKNCPQCGLALAPYPGSQKSEVIEIAVKPYRRLIRRKQYQPVCQCCVLPSIVTAPVFVAHPEIALDNNADENAVRGPVVGSKNYYGSGSSEAARFATSMFTVLLTLDQIWAINPRAWMTEFLQACAVGRGVPADLSIFLPWEMTPQRLVHFGGKVPVAPKGTAPEVADMS